MSIFFCVTGAVLPKGFCQMTFISCGSAAPQRCPFFRGRGSASDMWCDVFFANRNSVVCYKAQMYWPAETMVRVSFSWGAVLGEVPSWVEYHFLWQRDSTLHNLHCTRDSSLYPLHTLHSKCYTSTLRSSTVQSTHHTTLHSTLHTAHSALYTRTSLLRISHSLLYT